jgi:ferrochelatase
MDKYVIDVPFLLRALLVRGIILQTRPKTQHAKVWTDEGSPLIEKKCSELVDVPVSLAMLWKPFSLSGLRIT